MFNQIPPLSPLVPLSRGIGPLDFPIKFPPFHPFPGGSPPSNFPSITHLFPNWFPTSPPLFSHYPPPCFPISSPSDPIFSHYFTFHVQIISPLSPLLPPVFPKWFPIISSRLTRCPSMFPWAPLSIVPVSPQSPLLGSHYVPSLPPLFGGPPL